MQVIPRCRWGVLIALMVLVPLTAPSHQPATPALAVSRQAGHKTTLTLFLGGVPQSLDPQKSFFTVDGAIERLLFQPLFVFDAGGAPVPGLAEQTPTVDNGGISPDGLSYTIRIRPNQQFSDGQPLTAADVVYSIERLLDPGTDSPNAGFYRDIIGVEALDEQTVRFTRTADAGPSAGSFLARLALSPAAPLETGIAEAGGTHWTDPGRLVGNGPYVLTDYRAGQQITLERNPRYTLDPGPHIDTIVLQLSGVALDEYTAGRVDIASVSGPAVPGALGDPTLLGEAHREPLQETFGLAFNTVMPPFNDARVRRAFAQAIDRQAYVAAVAGDVGIPGATWLPPGLAGYDPANERVLAYDPAAARQLLADAGYPDGQGFPADVRLTYRSPGTFDFVARQLKQTLNVTILGDPVNSSELLRRQRSHQYQVATYGWQSDYPDADNWLPDQFGSAGASNASSYRNPVFDAAVIAAIAELDSTRQAALWAAAERILLSDAVVVPLYHGTLLTLAKPWVAGLSGGVTDSLWFGDHAFVSFDIVR